ncbi:MAG: chemotaxis protein CheA, partial [Burkholderiales bacterium]|nr:chemotaxis protein CheA [Burkholderiales bacterium]
MDKDTMAAALAVFMEEARDLIADMEAILLRLEEGTSEGDELPALFRCAHTIKGSAGMFGLEEVVRFTHVVESVLDRLRNREIKFDSDLASVLLESQDHIAGLIAAVAEGTEGDNERSNALIPRLSNWLDAAHAAPKAHKVVAAKGEPDVTADGGGILSDYWHVSLRFAPCVLTDGMDPLKFIQYLNHLGRIVHVETIADNLPSLQEADIELCYLGFEVALETQAGKEEIEEVFEFYGDNARIAILPPHSKVSEFLALIESLPEETGRLGEILVACGTLTASELERALASQAASDDPTPPLLGKLLVEAGVVEPAVVGAAVEKQRRDEEKRSNESKSLKVQSDRLDALIDRVGELVIAGSGNQVQAAKTAQPAMLEVASQLMVLVEDIRDMALRLRMVAIGEVFSRFPRVVRDVSRELGKEIQLTISGAEAELDKSMVEKVADPLMHLLRNSMDHGIEPASVRASRGKPEKGTVSLKAYHESGAIIIEVSDDGGGLDPEKILRKAIEKGIVAEGASLSLHDTHQLILAPGFSTAAQVTNLSGRGVGMDVVKSNVEALRGTLEIQSEFGKGT